MSPSPQIVSMALVAAIIVVVAAVVFWGVRTSSRGRKGGTPRKTASSPHKAAAATPVAKKVGKPNKDLPLPQRKYLAAKKQFNRAIDKRITREALVADRLRKTRDLVLGWYDQGGRVLKVRFQAKDARTACKVCQGRHNKEYDLLSPQVVSQILPPGHSDGGGRKDCECFVVPVLAAESQTSGRL